MTTTSDPTSACTANYASEVAVHFAVSYTLYWRNAGTRQLHAVRIYCFCTKRDAASQGVGPFDAHIQGAYVQHDSAKSFEV